MKHLNHGGLALLTLAAGLCGLFASPAQADPASATITIVQQGNSSLKISGASVTVYNNPTSKSTPRYETTRTTNSSGQASFNGLETNGVYLVKVSRRGCTFPGQDQNLGIPNNQTKVAKTMLLACPDVRPEAKATITVVQKGNSRVMISGAMVRVYKNPTSQNTPAYDDKKTTNSQGRASFTGLVTNGVYLVEVSKKGCTFPSQDQNIGIPNNQTSVTKTMLLDCP
jgi:hypothetical protein